MNEEDQGATSDMDRYPAALRHIPLVCLRPEGISRDDSAAPENNQVSLVSL
jgi:hypothetical protein